MRVVPVELGERRYDVLVGEGVRHELARVVAATVPGSPRRAAVVTQERIGVAVEPGTPERRGVHGCPTVSGPSR